MSDNIFAGGPTPKTTWQNVYGAVAGCLLASTSSFAQPAETSQFVQPPLGMTAGIVLDATGGRIMFPLPSARREFASPADFDVFLRQNLNATPIYDSSGTIVAAEGTLLQQGETFYLDPLNNIRPIIEPISAFIGGLAGTFTVGGITYSTEAQGSAFFGPSGAGGAPSDVYHCNSSGECVSGHSWVHHYFFGYHTVGTSIRQETGGYRERRYFCWRGIIPWICVERTGTNDLTARGTVFVQWSTVPIVYNRFPATIRHDVSEIKLGYWAWSFITPSIVSSMVGACGIESSAAVPSTGATVAGTSLDYECFGGGVTCSAGYTQCPNNVCANLTSDLNNCGICGRVCPAGPPNSARTCSASQCGFVCNPGYTLCSGACVNLASDPNNCGICGRSCGTGTCVGGQCQACTPSCPPGSCGGSDGCGGQCWTCMQYCCDGICCNGPVCCGFGVCVTPPQVCQ